ncbi:hypothetical protein Clacol_003509 [Clathrus columnatus]|uniref:Pheromone receptor n=1 Tax=Clathrus columnatus TaxID=1419009 RepID=A0AAV5A3W4_9AGAM|nr:hypothetical protein Clacol_003509 [Clathrus columnatus]
MQHLELPIVSFFCFFIVLSVLPSQIRASNIATIGLIAWLSILTLIRGVNSLIWAGNVAIKVSVWCDIATKLTIGFTFAVPAAVLCISTRLESMASTRNTHITISQKRTRQIFEFVMCFGLPALFMGLLSFLPGDNLNTLSVLSFYRFLRLRTEFALHLRNNNSSIIPSYYLRLLAMAVIINILATTINVYILIVTNGLNGGLLSWANAQSNWSFIAVYLTSTIPASLMTPVTLTWWIVPILCFIVFIFLGFNVKAWEDYRSAAHWVWSKVLTRKRRSSPLLPLTKTSLSHDSVFSTQAHKPWHEYLSPMTQTQSLQHISRPISRPNSSINTPSSNSTSDIHEVTLEIHPYAVLPERPSTADSRAARDSDNSRRLPEEIATSSEYQRPRLFTFPKKKQAQEVEVPLKTIASGP